jgi:hypothetical protein
VITSERPLQTVVLGAGACLEEFDRLREVLSTTGQE